MQCFGRRGGCRVSLRLGRLVEQKPLTAGRDVEEKVEGRARRRKREPRLEQRALLAGYEAAGGVDADVDGHDRAVLGDIEELAAVVAPTRVVSAARADLLLVVADVREGLDDDLKTVRLVGGVREPTPVRRETPRSDRERELEQRIWRFVVRKRQNPKCGFLF